MRRAFIRATAALAAIGLSARAAAQATPAARAAGKGGRVKVVYQLSEGVDQAVRAMGNLRNHLNGAPDTKIVVVAFGYGIDFLVEGAKDARGNTFDGPVGALAAAGVEFRVCRNTLTARKISESSLLMEAKVVPAGVVEIARLQAEEGYAYIKP
ncbi:DsrE family protein [Cupriavidus necator]|uniref:DsrE family protein n=1 Tax=Cupriavidus necator TaxID=106590 RepID=UPI0027801684|nr:DsrE family protein [Cupriavidus necator]MDQ0142760.1 intracellular sulfur oxidation DsrE/DsrF family protein [Cupriavidus necator]